MKQVFASAFQDEALVVKSLLDSAGLESALMTEGILDAAPLFGTGVKGVRVMVRDEDEADAAAVVADYRARPREEER